MELLSSSGDIYYSGGNTDLLNVETSSGNISLESLSGDIRLPKALSSNDENFVEASVGSGGQLLSIMTSSGDVTLK